MTVTAVAAMIVVVAAMEAAKTATVLAVVRGGKVAAAEMMPGEAVQDVIRVTVVAPVRAAAAAEAAVAVVVAVVVDGACAGAGAVEIEETAVTGQSAVIVGIGESVEIAETVESAGTVEIVETVRNGRMASGGAGVQSTVVVADGDTLKESELASEAGRDGGAARASVAALTAAVKVEIALTRSAPAELEASVAARSSPRVRSPVPNRRRTGKNPIAAAAAQNDLSGKRALKLKLQKRRAAAAERMIRMMRVAPKGDRSETL